MDCFKWVRTMMGRDLVTFWLMEEYHPNTAVMEKPAAPKFYRPIRLLVSFTQNFSRKALSFEFIYCMAVQYHDWNLLNKFLLLIQVLIQDFVREGGWVAGRKNYSRAQRREKCLGLFWGVWGHLGAWSPRKILKLKVPDWLKMHFLTPLQ